jgi:hypothetical protein
VEFQVDPAGRHDVFPQERVFDFFEMHILTAIVISGVVDGG